MSTGSMGHIGTSAVPQITIAGSAGPVSVSAVGRTGGASGAATAGAASGVSSVVTVRLSDEQQRVIDEVRAGRDVIVDATVGSGKALMDRSLIPTPQGLRSVGSIRPGDLLYGRRGEEVMVSKIFPQGLKRVYVLTTADGRKSYCSGDHNWLVSRGYSDGVGSSTWEIVVTTLELIASGLRHSRARHGQPAFMLPVHEGIALHPSEFDDEGDHPEIFASIEHVADLALELEKEGEKLYEHGLLNSRLSDFDRKVVFSLGSYISLLVTEYDFDLGLGKHHDFTKTAIVSIEEYDGHEYAGEHEGAQSAEQRVRGSIVPDGAGVSAERAELDLIGVFEPMTCFTVVPVDAGVAVASDDAGEHLFLAEDYLVTHNTTVIQQLCNELGDEASILYLTYSKLLKLDAQNRVRKADKVQNYHGIVYPSLRKHNISAGISESVKAFNDNFKQISASFKRYDILVVDEYQDINEEYAQLLRNIKSLNPVMQVVLVGDLEQKVKTDTVLDAAAFAKEITNDPVLLPFTQSFRIGPELAGKLAQAWNKPVIGANTKQIVGTLDHDTAIAMMENLEPGEILGLGRRNGQLADALNQLEKRLPAKFNKHTTFASIRDGDSSVTYGPDTAVFTTFDSSKGLERPVAFVFDYNEQMWRMRASFPNVDPEVLRNIFLVAASRGKSAVYFVEPRKMDLNPNTEASHGPVRAASWYEKHGIPAIGALPIKSLLELPEVTLPIYEKPLWVSEAFDFKYAENVRDCYEMLTLTRLDNGTDEVIEIKREDGLIDLSPAVGNYQEAVYFEKYNIHDEFKKRPTGPSAVSWVENEVTPGNHWRNALLLAAYETEQARYADQVTATINTVTAAKLKARLAEHLPADAPVQLSCGIVGEALERRNVSTKLEFRGIIDALHDSGKGHGIEPWELKFTSELTYSNFLQLALYLVFADFESGVLWNTRTGERWRVEIPDKALFMNAVTNCVTKQAYRAFRG